MHKRQACDLQSQGVDKIVSLARLQAGETLLRNNCIYDSHAGSGH